jgi:ABC-2 type transport system permease protein
MRFLALFKKTMLENIRDWKIIILTVTFAPFFVVLMYFYFGETVKPYRVIVIDNDQGVVTKDSTPFHAGKDLISMLKDAKYPDGKNILDIKLIQDMSAAKESLKDKSADLVVEIPGNFSNVLNSYKENQNNNPVTVKSFGNPTNPRYIMAAVFSDIYTYRYAEVITGRKGPLEVQQEAVGDMKSLNDFDLYVPGLLALCLMMLMFTAAASLIKEKDKGTIIRLRLSKITMGEFFASVSVTQVIIGMIALALTFLTAVALGYHTSGSLLDVTVLGILSCLSIIAISLLVAGFLRTIFDLMTIGCFPFFILMFFSGGMFPIPPIALFSLGERTISINDILPTTHTINGMNKILNFGAGLGDIVFEIGAIAILTLFYFLAGLLLFKKRHLQADRLS